VTTIVAQSVGVRGAAERAELSGLVQRLREKQVLLVLDNFEQVVSAAPILSDILMECPRLKMLVTSRENLHLLIEHQFWVPPLALPDLVHLPPIEALKDYPAVALFVE